MPPRVTLDAPSRVSHTTSDQNFAFHERLFLFLHMLNRHISIYFLLLPLHIYTMDSLSFDQMIAKRVAAKEAEAKAAEERAASESDPGQTRKKRRLGNHYIP
jgi:hypothetical protein